MDYLWGFGVVAFLAYRFIRSYRSDNAGRAWERPLGPVVPTSRGTPVLLCRIDDMLVFFCRGVPWKGGQHLFFRRNGEGSEPAFEVTPRRGWPVERPAASGDPALDNHLLIGGVPKHVAAALDPASRRCLLALFDDATKIEGGRVLPALSSLPTEQILAACPGLPALAQAFSLQRTEDTLQRALLHNARHDPVPGVRSRNLEVLLESFGSDPAVVRAATAALEDGDATVRLFAAAHAPAGVDAGVAWATLLELARGPHQAQLRAQALRALVRRSEPRPKVRDELRAFLRDPSDLVRSAAYEELTALGWQPEQGALALAPAEGGELSLAQSTDPTRIVELESSAESERDARERQGEQ